MIDLLSGNQAKLKWSVLSSVSCLGSPTPVGSNTNFAAEPTDASTHLPAGERAPKPPSPSRTAGDPSVFRTKMREFAPTASSVPQSRMDLASEGMPSKRGQPKHDQL